MTDQGDFGTVGGPEEQPSQPPMPPPPQPPTPQQPMPQQPMPQQPMPQQPMPPQQPPPAYGTPPPVGQWGTQAPQPYARQWPNSGFATAALVLGIIGVVITCVWYIAVILDVLAIIFGSVALNKAKSEPVANVGMAKAGLVLGCVGIGLILVVVLLFASSLASLGAL